jgi:hydroxymethylpyrimidine/phosphomethylpyrimidine kinase
MPDNYTPTVLTIAGSDPYGGAGIQIDCKTIHALDAYAFSVTTALTAQNSQGVKTVQSTSSEMFREQLEILLNDIKVDSVKIGMLINAEIISIVAESIDKYDLKNIILDTVLLSSSGKVLLEPKAIDIMVKDLFPRVDLITPNLPEINTLLNTDYVGKKDEVREIANAFFDKGVRAILIKGGHSLDKNEATDYLVTRLLEVNSFTTPRVHTSHTHGTGCLLSSAIASHLAQGESLKNSVAYAKDFLYKNLLTASEINFNYVDPNAIRKEPIL